MWQQQLNNQTEKLDQSLKQYYLMWQQQPNNQTEKAKAERKKEEKIRQANIGQGHFTRIGGTLGCCSGANTVINWGTKLVSKWVTVNETGKRITKVLVIGTIGTIGIVFETYYTYLYHFT
jgi:hypothetical protein